MNPTETIVFSHPKLEDSLKIHALIENCPPLDLNSSYCYMLCSSLWADTSICTWNKDQLIGFISALIRPDRPDTLFIWQVAVDKSARGQRLAQRMMQELLKRPIAKEIKYIHTTISPDNTASWGTFNSLTQALKCESRTLPFLDKDTHFNGLHESEDLLEIGPFHLP